MFRTSIMSSVKILKNRAHTSKSRILHQKAPCARHHIESILG